MLYTAREGVYKKVLEEVAKIPVPLPELISANFHCSPAAVQKDDGSFVVSTLTATASFQFFKWLGRWFKASRAKLIIGKVGMTGQDYKMCLFPMVPFI